MGYRGGFNEIDALEDKQGGNRRGENSFSFFRSFIRDIEMEEIRFKGRRWTWANNRQGEGFIEERLDMFFGSESWLLDFDKSMVQHILTQSSDHSMVLLDTEPQHVKGKSRFIYDSRWSKVQNCVHVIQEGWRVEVQGSRMFKFYTKLKHCKEKLLVWRKKESSNSNIKIQHLRGQMECLQERGGQRDWEAWHQLKLQLEATYKDEEEYWARKSRVEWLQEGEQNTKFFHSVTSQRRRSNRIDRLENLTGGVCEGEAEVTSEVCDFYKSLFYHI